jgi:hypothetical protein
MAAMRSTEASVSFTTLCGVTSPKVNILHDHRCENIFSSEVYLKNNEIYILLRIDGELLHLLDYVSSDI